MKTKHILQFAVLGTMLAISQACTHEEIPPYSGCKAGIYIMEPLSNDAYGNITSYRTGDESFTFTKKASDVKEGIIGFYVRLMGEVEDYDRPYKFVIVPDSTDAIEGVDFDLSLNEFKIKAGKNSDLVRVKLLRNERLIQNIVKVTFQILPNEHFETPITKFKNSAGWNVDGPICDATMFYVKFGEKYMKPDQWDNGSKFYGGWSVNKMLLMHELMDWVLTDWDSAGAQGAKIGYGRLQYAASVMQRYLQEQADNGTPMLDDDGSYMQLGNDYMVDYSAYK